MLSVVPEPIVDREEALNAIWVLTDILAEVRRIREVLDDGEEEEEDLGE
jgi:hypothetical protein